jgi:hypothetical protein
MSKDKKKDAQDAQDTGKYRTNTKDQFYTSPSVAKKCIKILISVLHDAELHPRVLPLSSYLWVEPSAGQGAFLNSIPDTYDKIGIDIEPGPGADANILKQDFLTWVLPPQPPKTNKKPVIIFGNPPFGRQSSLAKAFIAHSCKIASTYIIAFILPRSFVKPSMSCAFESHFHCIHSSDVERNAFVLGGGGGGGSGGDSDASYDVPCVFQIWQKRSVPRMVPEKITEKGFRYVKGTDPHNIVIRRVGVYAGRCFDGGGVGAGDINNATEYNKQTHYFIKLDEQFVAVQHIKKIVDKINAHVFPTNTTGPRSLSKPEINIVLNLVLNQVIGVCVTHAANL